jgi:hypothetical protein
VDIALSTNLLRIFSMSPLGPAKKLVDSGYGAQASELFGIYTDSS